MTKELTSQADQETSANLSERWLAFWHQIGTQEPHQEYFQDLVTSYNKPQRYYHTPAHISHCLDEFEKIRHLAQDPLAVEMAIWYHDVVYDPHAQDNEEKSAVVVLEVGRKIHLSESFCLKVANLITATKHNQVPSDTDAAIIIDIDLSGFGKSWEEVERDTKLIRQEYQWVSDREFAAGRMAILKVFLGRPSIYLTAFFREECEAQARQNLQRTIENLTKLA